MPFGSLASLLRSASFVSALGETRRRVADLVGELHALLVRLVLVVAAELVVEDVRVRRSANFGNQRLRHAARRADFVGRDLNQCRSSESR